MQVPPGNWFAPPGSNRNRGGGNESVGAFEPHEEPHRGAVFDDQVLQHEEFDVTPEVLGQREKVGVLRQRLTEWAALDKVMPAACLLLLNTALVCGLWVSVESEGGGHKQLCK